MRTPRRTRGTLALLVVFAVAGAVTIRVTTPGIERWIVGIHQKSVTRSLAAWGLENSQVTNDATAVRAAELVGYISSYYVPGPGYRGPREGEAALERQRRETMSRIVASLELYTGQSFGTNTQQWIEWAKERKGGGPHRATNRTQPIPAETN